MADRKIALNRMMAYCARKEACKADIRDKLRKMDLPEKDCLFVIEELVTHKFIDEDRFARAFVRDKYRFNSWGRAKIRYHLQQKGIPPQIIDPALQEIEEEGYQDQLCILLRRKLQQLSPVEDPYKVKASLIRFAAGRGFESGLVYACVESVMGESENQVAGYSPGRSL